MTLRSDDPLVKDKSPLTLREADRPFFATGLLLDAEDFEAEQTYHRSRLATVLARLHECGTVSGLDVVLDPALEPGDDDRFPQGRSERLRVRPGIALDRAGRIIESNEDYCIDLNRWIAAQDPDSLRASRAAGEPAHLTADVFVRFAACERGRSPAFASDNRQSLNAVVPSRLRDSFEHELVLRESAIPTPAGHWPEIDPQVPVADRRRILMDAILGREERLAPVEYDRDQDPTSVFLCRLQIPVDPPAAAEDAPRRNADPIRLDNEARLFVVSAAALMAWVDF